ARAFVGHTRQVWALALAPDEKTLASASHDGRLLSWDLAGMPRIPREVKLEPRQRDAYWRDLTGLDAPPARRAVCALSADPGGPLPLARKRLTPRPAPGGLTPAQIDRLIADLNDDEFGVRERASALLEKAGSAAEAALRKALAAPASAEARKRIEQLLRLLPPGGLRAVDLAAIRGVQVLEYI